MSAAEDIKLGPAVESDIDYPFDSLRLETWDDSRFVRGQIDAINPWRARGVVSLPYQYQVDGEFRTRRDDWTYEQNGDVAKVAVWYFDGDACREWTDTSLALDEDMAEDVSYFWMVVIDHLRAFAGDWRWRATFDGDMSRWRSADHEADARGIPMPLLEKFCRRYGVGFAPNEICTLVDSIALDHALRRLIEHDLRPIPESQPRRGGTVYFLRAERTGLIKIGVTADVEKRLKAIRTMGADQITLLATMKGDVSDERNLHQRFKLYRKHGEWFEPTGELLELIAELRRKP